MCLETTFILLLFPILLVFGSSIDNCLDQAKCLKAIVTKPNPNICQFKVCVHYDSNNGNCPKGDESPSHICLGLDGFKDFCKPCNEDCDDADSDMMNQCTENECPDGDSDGYPDIEDEGFCCDRCTEAAGDPVDGFCAQQLNSSDICYGLIQCVMVTGGETVSIFGMKDGNDGCMADLPDPYYVDLGNTEGAEFTCGPGQNGGNFCDGQNKKECEWKVYIPECDPPPVECATTDPGEILTEICELCECVENGGNGGGAAVSVPNKNIPFESAPTVNTPNKKHIDTVSVPKNIYNAAYCFFIIEIIMIILFIFKRYLLSTKKKPIFPQKEKVIDSEEDIDS